MNKFFKKIRQRPWTFGFLTLALIAVVVLISKGGGSFGFEEHEVKAANLEQAVLISGVVEGESSANLSFGVSGEVEKVNFSSGDLVGAGDIIARLNSSLAGSDLLQAQASLDKAQASYQELLDGMRSEEIAIKQQAVDSAFDSLQNTKAQQNELLSNSYIALLNDDLEAVPDNSNNSSITVNISGFYTGLEEGDYIIQPYSSGGSFFNYNGLDSGISIADDNTPQPLGSSGLYVKFSTLSSLTNKSWTISIPNKQGASYVANLTAYSNAAQTKNITIANAQAAYDAAKFALDLLVAPPLQTELSLAQAEVDSARGKLVAAQQKYRYTLITAPFAGTIGKINLEIGEFIQSNTAYVSIVGGDEFDVVLKVPQIDVSKISEGDMVSIIIDAFGEDNMWQGSVSHIDIVDTIVDGISVYETKVNIVDADERIRIGMTAKAKIVIDQKQVEVSAPKHFLLRDENGYYVLMFEEGFDDPVEKRIKTGIEGTNGLVEIVEGLNAGEVIVKEVNPFTAK